MPNYNDLFLKNILARPNDDTLRLVYTDWLDENGENDRAEFIRLQCQSARERKELPKRALDLFLRNENNWLKNIPKEFIDANHRLLWISQSNIVYATAVPGGSPRTGLLPILNFHKGFLHRVFCTVATWMTRGGYLTLHHPIEMVHFVSEIRNDTSQFLLNKNWTSIKLNWPNVKFSFTDDDWFLSGKMQNANYASRK